MARGPRLTTTHDAAASPFASRGSERPIQMEQPSSPPRGNPPGATGPHAIAARPPLEPTRPIDEGDDGFTSGRPASKARFRRLDSASALSASQSRLAIRPLAAKRSPATISISMASRVEFARWRRRSGGAPSSIQRTRGTPAISGSRKRLCKNDRLVRESAASLRSTVGSQQTEPFRFSSARSSNATPLILFRASWSCGNYTEHRRKAGHHQPQGRG